VNPPAVRVRHHQAGDLQPVHDELLDRVTGLMTIPLPAARYDAMFADIVVSVLSSVTAAACRAVVSAPVSCTTVPAIFPAPSCWLEVLYKSFPCGYSIICLCMLHHAVAKPVRPLQRLHVPLVPLPGGDL